jgi:hypothetical protein
MQGLPIDVAFMLPCIIFVLLSAVVIESISVSFDFLSKIV